MRERHNADLTFLAPPGEVADWRLAVTYATALEHGLIEALPGRAEELGEHLTLDPHSVRVLLDALGAWSIVVRERDGCYVAGPSVPNDEESLLLWHHARAIAGWTHLADALRQPVRPRGGAEAPPPDQFQGALAVMARRRAPSLVDAILEVTGEIRSMLDLGGGHGEYALEFSRRGVRAVLQDREAMIEAARRRGVVNGHVELFAGDFFETLPREHFELVLIAGVTHTYDAEHNVALFRRAADVLRPGGALAVVTMLQRHNEIAALFAVQMLVNGGGGDTHAEGDYRRWLGDTGYGDIVVSDVPGVSAQSIILARR